MDLCRWCTSVIHQRWALSVVTTHPCWNSKSRLFRNSTRTHSWWVHDSTIVWTWRPILVRRWISARLTIWVCSIIFHPLTLMITSAAKQVPKVCYANQPRAHPYISRTYQKVIICQKPPPRPTSTKVIKTLTHELWALTWRHSLSKSSFQTLTVRSTILSIQQAPVHTNMPHHPQSLSNNSTLVLSICFWKRMAKKSSDNAWQITSWSKSRGLWTRALMVVTSYAVLFLMAPRQYSTLV